MPITITTLLHCRMRVASWMSLTRDCETIAMFLQVWIASLILRAGGKTRLYINNQLT